MDKQHRLVVLGSMDEFVELVRCAQRRGIFTIVCDGYPNGPAKRVADASYDIDVRDTDAIADLCRAEGADGIIASFSDVLAESLVAIADKAGLPCYAKPSRFRTLRDKTLMKHMFGELGIPAPKATVVTRDAIAECLEGIGFPCVVKPLDGYGSRGVFLLSSAEEVERRFDEVASYSSADCILAEEYVVGHELNMMNWMLDGEVVTIGIADREVSREIPQAIPHVSRIVYPSRFAGEVLDEARGIVAKVAAHIGIETGPISMQFFRCDDGGIKVCEIAGRLFGYEHELVTLASGLSIEELLVDYVYDRDAMRARLEGHTPFYTSCSAGLYFHGHERAVADAGAAIGAAQRAHAADMQLYYQPGEVVGHGVGAKPYVFRCYISGASRRDIDEASARLFEDVRVLDDAGADLLYANQIANSR